MIGELNIGKWKLQIGASKGIATLLVEELERFLNKEWKEAVLEEIDRPWWSVEYLEIPSLIVRVDMSPTTNPETVKSSIYEVEVRPAGLGLFLSLAAPQRIKEWRKILVKNQGFINIQSSIRDDILAASILETPYYEKIPSGRGPYWVRTNLREGEIVERLEDISLVPIVEDGNKTYLLKLGMAERITKELDWSNSFVVKPLIGARMEGVEIYFPNNSLQEKLGPGISTKSRVLRAISGKVPYIIQRFISPLNEEIGGVKGWTIWRLFFGWKDTKYRFIGGLWNWRPNLRVHGALDAVFGLVENSY